MEPAFLRCLIVLHREQDWTRAAAACHMSEPALTTAVQALEADHGQPLVNPGSPFQGFTAAGEQLVAGALELLTSVEAVKLSVQSAQKRTAVGALIERRSVSPKRLGHPGPQSDDIHLMLEAALHAPDHGSLHPWRILEFHADHREALADLFEQEKRRRDPLASAQDFRRAREHAIRAPALLAFVVSPKAQVQVPVREQWLAAGAALGNLLNAAHQLGFGAIVLSGDRCFDLVLSSALGLVGDEFLAGFVSLGSLVEVPPRNREVRPDAVRSRWMPRANAAMPFPRSTAVGLDVDGGAGPGALPEERASEAPQAGKNARRGSGAP